MLGKPLLQVLKTLICHGNGSNLLMRRTLLPLGHCSGELLGKRLQTLDSEEAQLLLYAVLSELYLC